MPKSSLPTSEMSKRYRTRLVAALRREVQDGGIQRDERPAVADDQLRREEMDQNSEEGQDQPIRRDSPVPQVNDNFQQDQDELPVAEDGNGSLHSADHTSDGESVEAENNSSDGSSEGEVNEGSDAEDNFDGEDSNDENNDSEEEEDDGDGNINGDIFGGNLGNQPLYAGAPITVGESVVSILTFMLNHSITGSCIADLLTLIQIHCPPVGLVKLSLYKLKRYFQFSSGPVKKHYYCSVCCQGLQTALDVCHVCQRRKPVSYFIQIPIVPQLKKLFARPGFYEHLQHRFTRTGPKEGYIEDVFDAMLYKEQVNEGFLANRNNLSFSYFSDGVPVFKSKNYSFWGFYLTVNELPYRMRIRRENTLLAGLWFGPTKPHANLFMSSFFDDLRKIYQGIRVSIPGVAELLQVSGKVLFGVADTPARSTLMNLVHHNGFHGCAFCEIRGETVHLPSGGDTHCYRYHQPLQKRTLERMIQQAREAFDRHLPVMGVKGPTALMAFLPNFIRGTGIDVMHLLMGIVRKFMKLHFDPQYGNCAFSLRPVLNVVNRELQKMRPPKFVHRLPRSLVDYGHWKASELKVWFFYYSVPILETVMRPNYFNHYLKLVIALSYLNAGSVSLQMIDAAERLLHEFVREFEVLYGLRFCSINMHMLLHLADCVRELGPTWVYTCFPYENINGEILRVIHGKSNVDSQVSRMHWHCLDLPLKINLMRNGLVRDFCLRRKRQVRLGERVLESCYTIGPYSDRNVQIPMVLNGLQNSQVNFTRLMSYNRLLKNSLLYISENYTRDLKSCSSYAAFRWGGTTRYGPIYTFVKAMTCRCDFDCNCAGNHFAIIRCLEKASDVFVAGQPNTLLHHMQKCRMVPLVLAVPVRNLETVCFFMEVNDTLFIAEPVNHNDIE